MSDPVPNDLRVETRFKNAALYNALWDRFHADAQQEYERKGRCGQPGLLAHACRVMGVNYDALVALINLRAHPWDSRGRWRPMPARVADYLQIDAGALFPRTLYELAFNLPRVVVCEYQSPQVLALSDAQRKLIAESPATEIERAIDVRRVLPEALTVLNKREAQVIRMLFGLEGDREYTYAEVGQHLAVTPVRVRQIEAKALRKLRRNRGKTRELHQLMEDEHERTDAF